ncbi:hypothetical protein FDP08_03115 [Marinobacter panjinensis]|uniref:DUF6160 domain-containing protein n=1 Tax=Marinobacter panjinensis TaxID=2576384 RepID=A0A4U6R1F4_9GAMM|nr:DUF6160 family protein [Marinobacter panjinensis]MCR8915879.1 DUF6160 family protein [Marinobacter panjinensis]TKV67151.1 hypothetical protein FDP08_03115 [Marinobacter panjinensis]
MKGLKKIALATAVAAAPFAAQAELQAMDDSMMGNVTGQAGVTIELETQVEIGRFTYTDEGTFSVNDIKLGGATTSSSAIAAGYSANTGGTGLLDQLKIDIDVEADGDAVIHVGSLQTDPTSGDPIPIDWGMTAGSMELDGSGNENTVLVSNMEAWGLLGALDIRVDTDDVGGQAGTGTLNLDVAFTVNDMSFDADFLAIGVQNMSITGANTGTDATAVNGLTASGSENNVDLTAEEIANKVFGKAVADLSADEQYQLGLAQKGFALVGLDIYKGNGIGASTATDVLRIDVDNVLMDVNIGQTLIGGTNIGTIGIDNLHISNTKLAVYGH